MLKHEQSKFNFDAPQDLSKSTAREPANGLEFPNLFNPSNPYSLFPVLNVFNGLEQYFQQITQTTSNLYNPLGSIDSERLKFFSQFHENLMNHFKTTKRPASATQTSSSPNATATSKSLKDELIPNGYTKFRFNEDCNFKNCGYRNHQSHFHCCRVDCYYSFCDKTRFVQHTARHERLDKLMGDDFKQYRANMRCNHSDCVYNRNLGK